MTDVLFLASVSSNHDLEDLKKRILSLVIIDEGVMFCQDPFWRSTNIIGIRCRLNHCPLISLSFSLIASVWCPVSGRLDPNLISTWSG